MIKNKANYKEYSKSVSEKSSVFSDCTKAFFAGGLICTLAEAIKQLYLFFGINTDDAAILTPCTIIFITALLTALDIFDGIAKHAGAGTLVPISGFANAITAAAIDNKNEGLVLGLGAKIFTVAGPVILYGTASSVIYGIIYYISQVIRGVSL